MINTIVNGDSLEVLKSMDSESVDCIFADPPYWMQTEGVLERTNGTRFDGCGDDWDKFTSYDHYKKFTYEWLMECQRVLKKDGSIWVIGSMQCIYTVGAVMQELGFWFLNDVIWHKKNPTPNFRGTRLNNAHETLIWATKSKNAKYTFNYKTAKEINRDTVSVQEYDKGVRKQLGSVWRIAVCAGNERLKDDRGEKLHSTQKPEELLARVINISTKLGDLVLDPFAGSMTTGAVAKRCGRNYIMIEREQKYCDYGKRRLENVTPEIGEIEQAAYDVKPPRATITSMMDKGYFQLGEPFFIKGEDVGVILAERGKLFFMQTGEHLDIHTAAARFSNSKGDRLNGFDYWQVKRDGQVIGIDRIRKAYREKELNFKEKELF